MALDKHLHIEPFQTKTVLVNVVGEPVSDLKTIGMITPPSNWWLNYSVTRCCSVMRCGTAAHQGC